MVFAQMDNLCIILKSEYIEYVLLPFDFRVTVYYEYLAETT